MKQDDLTWLSTELGFPTLEESEHGVVANGPAQAALRDGVPASLELAAAAITGLTAKDGALCALLARARRGERATASLGQDGLSAQGWRVLAVPMTAGRARLTFAPAIIEQAGAIQRRAALVDVAAAVSHEVANAMGAITGWAELATGKGDSAIDAQEALVLIGSCARTAEQAARRMLSLARGENEDDESRTDVSELSGELVDLLTLTARQARVLLTANIEPSLVVEGSRSQLFTILWNLAKNAIEACPAMGQVSVHLHGDDSYAYIEVRDTGAGLDSATQQRIFTPYFTTKAGGTGLGLPLVRQAVEALGGSIGIESALGRGTMFRVSLPRVLRRSEVTVPQVERVRAQSDEVPTGAYVLDARVLVVDDDDALREMVATALSLRGARVTTARSSEEARKLEGAFDIALIDMMLDDCRGDDLLALLRKRGTVNAAMLVTGTVQKPKLVPGGEPDDWVRKPFEISQLVDRLKRTLERHRMLSAATATMRF